MEHLSNDHEDCPNQHENSHKLCDETGHPIVNLMESQWKLRQQHDQNFPIEGSSVIWGLLAQMGSGFFQILNHLKTLKYH